MMLPYSLRIQEKFTFLPVMDEGSSCCTFSPVRSIVSLWYFSCLTFSEMLSILKASNSWLDSEALSFRSRLLWFLPNFPSCFRISCPHMSNLAARDTVLWLYPSFVFLLPGFLQVCSCSASTEVSSLVTWPDKAEVFLTYFPTPIPMVVGDSLLFLSLRNGLTIIHGPTLPWTFAHFSSF